MSEDFKKIFQDKDGNDIPDIFEGKGLFNVGKLLQANMTDYVVHGKHYNSLEEMPPEIRQMVQEKLKKVKNFTDVSSAKFDSAPSDNFQQTAVQPALEHPKAQRIIGTRGVLLILGMTIFLAFVLLVIFFPSVLPSFNRR